MPPGIFFGELRHLLRARHAAAAEPEHVGEAGHRAALGAEPIVFITSAMVPVHLEQRLMSSTLVPEPAAMRFLRLALRTSGLRRSFGVIESMIAIWRLSTLLVEIGGGDLVLHLGDAGQHAHQARPCRPSAASA